VRLQAYTQRLPEGATQLDLLRMAAVADAFELRAVSAACLAHLAARSVLDWQTVTAAFAVTDVLAGHAAGRQLLENAAERLQQQLGDLEVSLQDAGRRRQLEALPQPALLALLRDPETRVAAESSAVAAVALWVGAQEAAGSGGSGGGVPLEQRQQLAAAIRMAQLPSVYLGTVVPAMGWLQGLITPQQMVTLFVAAGVPARYRGAFGDVLSLAGGQQEGWPPAWLADARPRSACQRVAVTLAVPVAQLNARASAGQGVRWASEGVVFGGYEFGVCLQLSERRTLRATMVLQAIGALPARPPGDGGASGAAQRPVAVVVGELTGGAGAGGRPHSAVFARHLYERPTACNGMYADGTGFDECFNQYVDMESGWRPELLTPFLQGDRLTLRLTVSWLLP
jgi:hypothetical protein